jgi:hypothetical protein
MTRAARLLRDGDLAMSEIASRSGHHSEASFNRAFKRLEGVAPGRYRRKLPPGTLPLHRLTADDLPLRPALANPLMFPDRAGVCESRGAFSSIPVALGDEARPRLVRGDPGEQLGEVGAGEVPVEGAGDLVVVALELV